MKKKKKLKFPLYFFIKILQNMPLVFYCGEWEPVDKEIHWGPCASPFQVQALASKYKFHLTHFTYSLASVFFILLLVWNSFCLKYIIVHLHKIYFLKYIYYWVQCTLSLPCVLSWVILHFHSFFVPTFVSESNPTRSFLQWPQFFNTNINFFFHFHFYFYFLCGSKLTVRKMTRWVKILYLWKIKLHKI